MYEFEGVNYKKYLDDLEKLRDKIRTKEVTENKPMLQMKKDMILNAVVKKVNTEPQERFCLKCDEYFMSNHKFHRICEFCTKANKNGY